MKKIGKLLALLLIILAFSSLYGQDKEASQESSRVMVLESLGQNRDIDQKELCLEGIVKLLDEGISGEELEQVIDLLTVLANEGITNTTFDGNKKGPSYPTIRSQAAIILGSTGQTRAITPLVNIIFYDDNEVSMIEAVRGIAKLGVDDKGKVLIALYRILKNTRLVYNHEKLIQETLYAIDTLSEQFPEVLENTDLIDGIDFVSQSHAGYGRTTRNLATTLLHSSSSQE